jgi:outer membrane protein TolC
MKRILPIFVVLAQMGVAQSVMQLSLKRAVDIALTPEGSARVALAEQSVHVSETHVNQARAAFYPNLDGSVTDPRKNVNLSKLGLKFDFPGFE